MFALAKKNKRMIQKAIMTLAALFVFCVSQAQTSAQAFLERYDLSYTVINPDTVPTDEVYSWWPEAQKSEWLSYGNEPMADRWLHRPEPLGFRGTNFQRFYIYFDTVYKLSPDIYHLEAHSKCKDESCQIQGEIVIDSVVPGNAQTGTIFANYELVALKNSKAVARLFGTSKYNYLLHNDSIYYDAMDMIADGFMNNQYTGKWIYRASDDSITCNWGDFRIPESQGLDIGTGMFMPNEKYFLFGWKSFFD